MSSGPLKRPRDAREEEQHVDWAIAASLAEAENEQPDALLPPGHWHCVRCTLVNKAESGRCAACEADREAPFTAAACGVATTPPPQRCGLPGCNRGRLHHGFCTDDHKQRAERRGLLAPAAPGVERVFVGSTGEYACDLLTRASPERSSVIEQFTIAWRKPGTVPRVERVYAIRPPPALSERFARHLAAVGNERRRFHGTGATCDFAVDLNRAPCNSRGCALCSILGHGISCPRCGMQVPVFQLALKETRVQRVFSCIHVLSLFTQASCARTRAVGPTRRTAPRCATGRVCTFRPRRESRMTTRRTASASAAAAAGARCL